VVANLVLPKIEGDALSQNYGRFIISPLESGYGMTLGTALRRVLLSSLIGAAVTSIRVSDVSHEFSAIPNVREDMTQLILNIKKLRLRLIDTEKARLRLEVRGTGTVTAADILCPPDVEIVNSDLYLFTVDAESAQIEIEMMVEAGRGYSPAEERGRLPIGELPIDAIFSPIKLVNVNVDRARVGQRTNYDKLILEIWTDGTVRPAEAMREASKVLINHMAIVAGVDSEMAINAPSGDTTAHEPKPWDEERFKTPIEVLDLSVRVFNSLKRTGITTVGEVLEMLDRGSDAMLAIRNFGEKSLVELVDRLAEKSFLSPEQKSNYIPNETAQPSQSS
jgi:DNA-directed RNA polymerase subunit alpha